MSECVSWKTHAAPGRILDMEEHTLAALRECSPLPSQTSRCFCGASASCLTSKGCLSCSRERSEASS